MIKIGVTGGIGSGKSTVCKYFESLGYTIFYSDIIAKQLANDDIDIKNQIIKEFSEQSYIEGKYNTKFISDIVFKNKSKLDILNNIFSIKILEKFNAISTDIIFFESALIFEHNIESAFDYIIGVYCDEETTYNRLLNRNSFNKEQADKIINNQLNTKVKMKKCNLVVDTTLGIDYKELDDFINNIKNQK
jgi:dephospho-CoA kinase